ncbi:MAG: hypothetical protein V7638_3881 [Acidobacteriota bacterium]|jgi:uncharacterized protein YegP (UPF0339 family)
MPCYTERAVDVKQTVAFKAENAEILVSGLVKEGFSANATKDGVISVSKDSRRAEINLTNGTMVVRESDASIVNEIKRAYSFEVVKQSASRFGWKLTATNDANVMTAKRRF